MPIREKSYKKIMRIRYFHVPAFVLATVLGLGACSSPAPYVERVYEFNREHPLFPDGPTAAAVEKAGLEVTVCYSKSNATPKDIAALAGRECGRFGASATFVEQSYRQCPLTTPIAAVFTCRAASASERRVQLSTAAPSPAAAPIRRQKPLPPPPMFLFNPLPSERIQP